MERLFNNQDLYPTPKDVIAQMFNYGSSPAGKIILEPSAGFGNIVDYCKINGAKEVIACEKDEKLRAIVGQVQADRKRFHASHFGNGIPHQHDRDEPAIQR